LTEEDTNLTITFEDVRNPANNGTNSTEDFQLYHIDSDNNIKAKNRNISGVGLVKQAPGLSIRNIQISNRNLFEKANYTFEFYTNLTLRDGYAIVLYLPA